LAKLFSGVIVTLTTSQNPEKKTHPEQSKAKHSTTTFGESLSSGAGGLKVKREAKVFKKTKALKHAVLISFLVPSNFFCFLSVRLGPPPPSLAPSLVAGSHVRPYSRLMVVVVYNSNSEVVVHFLMSTNERNLPKKRKE
jgi:hypothetical protein